MARYNLQIDTMLHLFNVMVKPILLYGCEAYGYFNPTAISMIERVQLQFCKILLNVRKSTPNAMVYGETGVFPIILDVKVRMVVFWMKLCQTNALKLSRSLMMVEAFRHQESVNNWFAEVRHVLDSCGMSNVWMNWRNMRVDWIKCKLERCLKDQYIQDWHYKMSQSSSCVVYKHLKREIELEKYICCVTKKHRILLTKFRCRSSKLPVTRAMLNAYCDNICYFCSSAVDDEPHVLLHCPFFDDARSKYLPIYFTRYPNNEKFCALFNLKGVHLKKLCQFIELIDNFCDIYENLP